MPTAIDAYLAKTPQPHRRTLTALRQTLRRLLPRAEQCIAYGMPCFRVDGKGVAGFAAFAAHCTYFPMSGGVIAALGKRLAAHAVSKGGVRFAPDRVLAPSLVRQLVAARLDELSQPPGSGNGPTRAYYGDGAPRYKGSYKGGRMHGKWEFYRRDGSTMRTGAFAMGKQVGIWKTLDRRGNVVKSTSF